MPVGHCRGPNTDKPSVSRPLVCALDQNDGGDDEGQGSSNAVARHLHQRDSSHEDEQREPLVDPQLCPQHGDRKQGCGEDLQLVCDLETNRNAIICNDTTIRGVCMPCTHIHLCKPGREVITSAQSAETKVHVTKFRMAFKKICNEQRLCGCRVFKGGGQSVLHSNSTLDVT